MSANVPTPERFFDTINAHQKTAAMKAAIDLGFFTAIAEGAKTSDQLAERCRISKRGARILADYLAILGFLHKTDNQYSLAEDAALFLDRNSPAYVGAAVEFLASPHVKSHFDNLAERVRAGGASLDDNSLTPNHEMWVRFARGMAGLVTLPAQMVARHTLALLGAAPKPMKVLDIAASHGMFGLAFLQQNPQARAVGLDWLNVLAVAQENAARFKVADRYQILPGSAFEVPFGSGYDAILIPQFLHHFDFDTNVTLLKKVHAALNPGGLAVTLEFSPDDNRLSPPGAGAFALVMLATTPAGDAYTVQEITRMYKAAGLGKVEATMLPLGTQRIITGVKE